MKKSLEDLKKLKEYIESENRLSDLDYAHYSVMIDYTDEAIAELEELENRSCSNCKNNIDVSNLSDEESISAQEYCMQCKYFYSDKFENKA